MIVIVTKKVKVNVTPEEIAQKRKIGGAFAREGVMGDDDTIALIIAHNKAIEAIAKNDKISVKTYTSLDDSTGIDLNLRNNDERSK